MVIGTSRGKSKQITQVVYFPTNYIVIYCQRLNRFGYFLEAVEIIAEMLRVSSESLG